MRTICVCGAFRLFDKPKGGQEIKTCIIADALEEKYGDIYRIDTLSHANRIKLIFQILWAMFSCKNIVILPAQNGVKLLSRLLAMLNVVFRKKLHYVVIGGWLQELLPKYPRICDSLKKFTGIYVETQTMKDNLIRLGLNNVYVVRNCKPISIVRENEFASTFHEPYRLITFSRVTEKKGIATASNIVMSLNRKFKREVYKLDIYGPIDNEDKDWFNELQKTFTDSISYKGNVPFNESVKILSKYFALLFPTQYYTEGIPGTIIDAYAAGVPVLASKWKSCSDVVINNITGYVYNFGKDEALESLLVKIIYNPEMITRIKLNCIRYASYYLPDNALKPLFEKIQG